MLHTGVPTPPLRIATVLIGVASCIVLGACGGSDDSDDAGATGRTTTSGASPETDSPTASSGTTSARPGDDDVWARTAAEHRGENGERFTIECTPGGTEAAIWGVETYTDDSSICTAAVHVGLITFEDGGEVEYEIAAGLDEYDSAIGNEVLSSRYPAYTGSFIFPDAPPGTGSFTVGAETWNVSATGFARDEGERVTIECAGGGPLGRAWGTGTYTSDSSICTAAVHAGLITVEDGGGVTFELAPGEDSYEGSTANGVTTQSYGVWDRSFTFPDDQPDD